MFQSNCWTSRWRNWWRSWTPYTASGRMKGNCPLRQDPKPCVAWKEGWQRAIPEQVEDGTTCGRTDWILVSYCSRRKAPSPPVQGLSRWDQRLYWGRSLNWLSLIRALEHCEPLKCCVCHFQRASCCSASAPLHWALLRRSQSGYMFLSCRYQKVAVGSTVRCVMCVPTVRNHPVLK